MTKTEYDAIKERIKKSYEDNYPTGLRGAMVSEADLMILFRALDRLMANQAIIDDLRVAGKLP